MKRAAAAPRASPFTVQPVSARANSVTSAWRVAAVDAERVQLQDFARQILVEAAPGLSLAGEAGGAAARLREFGADRLRLIEIEQHRRMLLDREQHVAELAQHMRPDRFEFEQPGDADDVTSLSAETAK